MGLGTTITILLSAMSAPVSESEAQQRLPTRGGGVILVVDDERARREVARRIVTRNGYEVLVADSGAQAIELASRARSGCC